MAVSTLELCERSQATLGSVDGNLAIDLFIFNLSPNQRHRLDLAVHITYVGLSCIADRCECIEDMGYYIETQ
jgi:hypothetical protein